MAIQLKNMTDQGEAAVGSYGSAASLTEIPADAVPAAQLTLKNTGTAGYWYVKANRSSGPTTTIYSWKLGPGEFVTEDNPPLGEVWALADGSANGPLSWYWGTKT